MSAPDKAAPSGAADHPTTVGAGFEPPDPGVTREEMIARAVALRPQLVADQEATERRTYYSQEMHEAFLDAGFYHLYVPRRYGGYEFDVPTYVRVVQEIARGCVSTAWCLGLAMNHALMVGSWWPQEAQDEIFTGGDFRCASVAAPVGKAAPTDGGWEINGQVAFASGSPYSTFYMGQAILPPGADANPGEPPPQLLFVAPRDEWEMLDDWGDMLGLKGSGSHSIRFSGTRIPASWGFEGSMLDVEVGGGTPRVATARQPDVLGSGGGGVHDLAGRSHGRGRVQRARRVRTADAHQDHAAAPVHPADQESRLPALVRPRAHAHRNGRGRAVRGRGHAHGGVPAQRRGRDRLPSARTCCWAESPARRC